MVTTTPVSFVYDVLFPYAREHLPAYVASHAGRAELDEAVRLLDEERKEESHQQELRIKEEQHALDTAVKTEAARTSNEAKRKQADRPAKKA